MRIKGFEFNLREFAGSLGDFGTLIPFLAGYVLINGFDPASILIMLGLTNLVLALIYKLPLPVQPQKALGSIAIANKWQSNMVFGTGLALGLFWTFLSIPKKITTIMKKIPMSVIRGIQLGLGLILMFKALEFMIGELIVALVSVMLIVLLLKKRIFPAAIAVLIFGILISFIKNPTSLNSIEFSFSLPKLYIPTLNEMFTGFLLAGIVQIPLTLTNAVIATTALIKDYFPDKEVSSRSLMLNMGVMNMVTSFFSGMPLCHGSGGLAAQYLYGARTGGALIMEGTIEIFLGLFLANSIEIVTSAFPLAVLGAMLFFTGLELGRIAFKIEDKTNIIIIIITASVSYIINLAVGFIIGLITYFILKKIL